MILFRSTHKAIVEAIHARIVDRDHTIATLAAELRDTQDRERVLVEKLLATRDAPPIPMKREPSAVDGAIAFKASGDRRLRSYLSTFARQERSAGKSEEEIAQRILEGDPVGDDEGIDG